MNLETFVEQHDVDYATDRIGARQLPEFEQELNVTFGGELKAYLLMYGYLGFEYVEFYGINSRAGLNSDMVTQTQYLHQYFPVTAGFAALENCSEGIYMLVGSGDEVLEFDTESGELTETGGRLDSYILARFQQVLSDTAESLS